MPDTLLTTSASAGGALARALHAPGPAPDRAQAMQLYGWLIGSWEMDATLHRDDGSTHVGHGTIAFGWVLEGRAIQDVWVVPGVFHGTTLRIYDPGQDAWHILWSDPVRQLYVRQIGRARGDGIIQEGIAEDGAATRWSFTEITPASFLWRGERSVDRVDWQLQAEFRARRVAD